MLELNFKFNLLNIIWATTSSLYHNSMYIVSLDSHKIYFSHFIDGRTEAQEDSLMCSGLNSH